ncbi:hypothetical protein KVT40_004554 [Elsinoe batatas]|uniref:Uncharacterized protein n=1 Tax=Elsinoe batatas TaxID=2601811 RepID=A0A8K0KZJ2_9PEZI|nr:hypothetical protein KVT40_004554 [Elsinoe batatas]
MAQHGRQSAGALVLTIGVDFGNSRSGAAVHSSWDKKTSPPYASRYLGAKQKVEKIPTRISYYPDGRVKAWGALVDPQQDYYEYFKLLLEKDRQLHHGISRPDMLRRLRRLRKTPIDIVADFLREMSQAILGGRTMARRIGPDLIDIAQIRWVITVPAIWSERAKHDTRQAAFQAGMGTDVDLVSEPAAAAIFMIESAGSISPNPDKAFVVCDVGGGTIDTITHSVDGAEDLSLSEVVEGDGTMEGGAFVMERFRSHTRGRLGGARFEQMASHGRLWQLTSADFEDVYFWRES